MNQKPHSSKLAVFALAGIALIWGYNWVQMKIAVQYAPPFTFATLRTVLGGVSLLIAMVALRKPLLPKEVPGTFLLGMFQTAGMYGLAMWALVSGGAGKTAVLVYTMPFWVLILAWLLLGERVRGFQWGAIGLSLVGLLLILEPHNLQGTIASKGLALLSGISWAGGAIVAKKLQKTVELDLLSVTAWQTLFGGIPLIVVMLSLPAQPIEWSPAFIGALLYNVIPGTAIAQLLWLYVLNNLPAGTAGLGTLMNPVLGVLFASAQLGERPTTPELAGMALIASGLVLVSLQSLRQSPLK